jgi:hypothetical protein
MQFLLKFKIYIKLVGSVLASIYSGSSIKVKIFLAVCLTGLSIGFLFNLYVHFIYFPNEDRGLKPVTTDKSLSPFDQDIQKVKIYISRANEYLITKDFINVFRNMQAAREILNENLDNFSSDDIVGRLMLKAQLLSIHYRAGVGRHDQALWSYQSALKFMGERDLGKTKEAQDLRVWRKKIIEGNSEIEQEKTEE